MRIRLSQPPAGDWPAGAWAELGNRIKTDILEEVNTIDKKSPEGDYEGCY